MSDSDSYSQPEPESDANRLLLDVRNLLCPLPVLRTSQRVTSLTAGDVLTVIATDPGALHDLPAWCGVHGHTLLVAEQGESEIRIRLQVNEID